VRGEVATEGSGLEDASGEGRPASSEADRREASKRRAGNETPTGRRETRERSNAATEVAA